MRSGLNRLVELNTLMCALAGRVDSSCQLGTRWLAQPARIAPCKCGCVDSHNMVSSAAFRFRLNSLWFLHCFVQLTHNKRYCWFSLSCHSIYKVRMIIGSHFFCNPRFWMPVSLMKNAECFYGNTGTRNGSNVLFMPLFQESGHWQRSGTSKFCLYTYFNLPFPSYKYMT